MTLSIAFIIVDIVAVTSALNNLLPDGLNPFWKLAFVFKCLTDSIVLDDFKTALDRLMRFKMHKERFGIVDDTVGATIGSSNIHDWNDGNGSADMAYREGEGTTTATAGGFSKVTSNPRPAPTGHEDPLGEDMLMEERMDMAEEQASAGAQEHNRGGASGAGRDISFWDALNEGRDLEKNATLDDYKGSTATTAIPKSVDHWDDLDLPEFETSSKSSSDKGKSRPHG